METTQRCGRCKQDKPLEDYAPSYRGKTGTWCRGCFAAYQRGVDTSAPHPPRACSICGTEYAPKNLKAASRGICPSQACSDAYHKQTGQTRDAHLRRRYGITAEQYDARLAAQGGHCALCPRTPSEQMRYQTFLPVDHDHDGGRVRGLLCWDCNLLLGRVEAAGGQAWLRLASAYLEAAA